VQAVDARGQDGLHRAGHVDRGQVVRQPVHPSLTRQRTRLDQRADALLDEERVTVGALDQQALERVQAGVGPEEDLEQHLGTLPWQRVDPKPGVDGLVAPVVRILGPMAGEQ